MGSIAVVGLVSALSALTDSCSRATSEVVDRIALLPATVLIADESQHWLTVAVPIVLQQDLATASSLVASYAADNSGVYQADANHVLRTTVEDRNGRLHLEATLSQLSSQTTSQVWREEGSRASGILPLLNSLAKKMDATGTSAFSTRSNEALRLFCVAIQTSNASEQYQKLSSAVRADPGFGLAFIARAENSAAANGDASQSPLLDAFTPLDRARWIALSSHLRHDSFQEQARVSAQVIQLAPNNVEALSALGWYRFLDGNAAEGERLLRKPISLSPSEVKLRLQLANGLVAAGQFSNAAKILDSFTSTNPNLLLPLSLIELLDGKEAEGDRTVKRFLSLLGQGPQVAEIVERQWDRFRGKAGSAAAGLEPAAPDSAGFIPFLEGRYGESEQYWRSAITQSGDTNLEARAMLAATLNLAKDKREQAIKVLPFLPEFGDAYSPVAFNQMRRLLPSSRR